MATWHTPTTVREWWPGTPPKSDALILELLTVAKGQILEFAPAIPITEPPTPDVCPDNYRLAQAYQTRALWESQQANVSGDTDAVGMEGYQVRVYDMSSSIRRILRPPQGFPGVG